MRSRYCEAELEYAEALSRPLLPIMVVDTKPGTAPLAVQTTNIVSYVDRGHSAVFGLAASLGAMPHNASAAGHSPKRKITFADSAAACVPTCAPIEAVVTELITGTQRGLRCAASWVA